MPNDQLRFQSHPQLVNSTLIMGFTGWMDGGDVSTGTIERLITELGAREFAEIEPDGFYIYSFPGSMEVSALFRPHTKIKDGLVESFAPSRNTFFFDPKNQIVLFQGKEPNVRWSDYVDCIFTLASEVDAKQIFFVGSVGGLVPHTRAPRLFCTVSSPELIPAMQDYGMRLTNYEGPGSIISYLLSEAGRRGLPMSSVIAEIPPYVEGRNIRCIESVIRQMAGILNLKINLDDLRTTGDELEKKLNEIVEQRPVLAKHIRKLEEDYDNEVFDSQMGDLKAWLEQQGIQLD